MMAAGLLAVMAALTVVALAGILSAGLVLVVNLILGGLAAALLHSVVLETRKTSARERTELAARMATQARERSLEHLRFATTLGGQLHAARAESARMSARTRDLEARLVGIETELARVRDALWLSEAAEKRARAALVVAEQAAQPGRHLRPA